MTARADQTSEDDDGKQQRKDRVTDIAVQEMQSNISRIEKKLDDLSSSDGGDGEAPADLDASQVLNISVEYEDSTTRWYIEALKTALAKAQKEVARLNIRQLALESYQAGLAENPTDVQTLATLLEMGWAQNDHDFYKHIKSRAGGLRFLLARHIRFLAVLTLLSAVSIVALVRLTSAGALDGASAFFAGLGTLQLAVILVAIVSVCATLVVFLWRRGSQPAGAERFTKGIS